MRKELVCLAIVSGIVAACAHEPTTSDAASAASATSATGNAPWGFGRGMMGFRRLPDSLKLTDAQRSQLHSLFQQFRQAHQADFQALAAAHKQAFAARQSGQSGDQVKQIMAQAEPAKQRLTAAQSALKPQVDAVLTTNQRAWLASHQPVSCNANSATALTDDQKAKMKALFEQFRQKNASDLATVQTAMRQAHSARQSGSSQAEVQQVFAGAKPAMDRLKTAHAQMQQAVAGILTSQQQASGCIPMMRAFGAGHMHGGQHS
ncbi:MAG TPA: hypothetical protein VEI06_01740 [Gemmatimonadaceae bacterium]|nr:hypothetical protein [Gemmatimonadaceae bacterium]